MTGIRRCALLQLASEALDDDRLSGRDYDRAAETVRHVREPALARGVNDLIAELDAAKGALEYALRRVGNDAEFAYHMLFTETLDRLVNAYAPMDGRNAAEVRCELMERAKALPESRCAADRAFIADGGRI